MLALQMIPLISLLLLQLIPSLITSPVLYTYTLYSKVAEF